MKKFKTICSAVAALTMLALAGCDLEIPKDKILEEPNLEDLEVTVDDLVGGGDAVLPLKRKGTIFTGTTVSGLSATEISESTGLSISFWILLGNEGEVHDNNTYEWESPVKLSDLGGANVVWIDVGPLGVWLASGGENFFEGEAQRGPDFPGVAADNWQIFCWERQKMYMSVSFNPDGSIVYYKNGKRALTYAPETKKGGVTVAEGCSYAIDNALNGVLTLHATNTNTYGMKDFTIDKGLDDDAAASLYADASKE